MLSLKVYQKSYKSAWDSVVEESANGHFMFKRDYMDYHADRFQDHSFLIFRDEEVVGIIPGNKNGPKWFSHQGLTFGGIVLKAQCNKAVFYQNIFSLLFLELKKIGCSNVVYKFIPHIYHASPCEGDLYALHFFKIKKLYAEISTAVNLRFPQKMSQLRLRGKKKALNNGLKIFESTCFDVFWDILSKRLDDKYEKKPVHSLEEIQLLHKHFPHNIRLFVAEHPEYGVCAGTVIYETKTTAHAQYISSSQLGMELGALDLLFCSLIEQYQSQNFNFFDFGISTENKGEWLNENLIQFKEGFGGGSIVYSTFELEL